MTSEEARVDALTKKIEDAIATKAAVWLEDFDGVTGRVVGVFDAAIVAAAEVADIEADRDRARDAAVALEQEVSRARELHSPFKIYEPCGHEHEETDKGVTNVIEVGSVCQDGFMYTVCCHCCTDDGDQTEECAAEHDHSDSGNRDGLCATLRALDGGAQ